MRLLTVFVLIIAAAAAAKVVVDVEDGSEGVISSVGSWLYDLFTTANRSTFAFALLIAFGVLCWFFGKVSCLFVWWCMKSCWNYFFPGPKAALAYDPDGNLVPLRMPFLIPDGRRILESSEVAPPTAAPTTPAGLSKKGR